MKRFSKKTRTILVVLAVCIGLSAVLAGYLYVTRYSKDAVAVQEALLACENLRADIAKFSSHDGTTASLSDAEIASKIESYNQKVDQYYTKENPSNPFLKELYRHYLEEVCKSEVSQVVDSAVSIYHLRSIAFHKGGNEATISAVLCCWTKGISNDDLETHEILDKYHVMQNPVGTDTIKAKLVKEDGSWKVSDVLTYTPLAVWNYDNVLKNAVLQSIKVRLSKKPETAHCLEEIQKNEKILDTQYDTYQEALTAVENMDLEHGNYFALAKLCGVILSDVHNVT